jgi:hypothetical protein
MSILVICLFLVDDERLELAFALPLGPRRPGAALAAEAAMAPMIAAEADAMKFRRSSLEALAGIGSEDIEKPPLSKVATMHPPGEARRVNCLRTS